MYTLEMALSHKEIESLRQLLEPSPKSVPEHSVASKINTTDQAEEGEEV